LARGSILGFPGWILSTSSVSVHSMASDPSISSTSSVSSTSISSISSKFSTPSISSMPSKSSISSMFSILSISYVSSIPSMFSISLISFVSSVELTCIFSIDVFWDCSASIELSCASFLPLGLHFFLPNQTYTVRQFCGRIGIYAVLTFSDSAFDLVFSLPFSRHL
jgi:hypothetical protein